MSIESIESIDDGAVDVWLITLERYQAGYFDLRNVFIDDPVHEIEAREADRKNDSRVFVNVGRTESPHLVRVFTIQRRRKEKFGGWLRC